ncbi:MAG: MBL fold metallo-hydrolase [Gemmatimonadota bacterium]|nr:MAG: MBL fold metallo-hydrolase [Gemmatimonadota bacterium]
MQFIFEQIRTGGDRNFAYLIGDRDARVAAIVDPSYTPDVVVERATAQQLSTEYIINTHGHADHTNGNRVAKKLTGAQVVAFRTSSVSPDLPVDDGQVLELGSLFLELIHVPGHTDDHIVVYLERQGVAVTGDHLFVGKIGGTGSDRAARSEFESIRKLLDRFPDAVTIWPGHDYGCRPSSTMALEKETNPFILKMDDIDEFLKLKRDWAVFKAEMGLK